MRVIQASLETHSARRLSQEFQTSNWETVSFSANPTNLRHFLSQEQNILLLAILDKRIAGYLIAYKLDKIDQRDCEILLYELEVKPEYRRQGVATALIDYLASIAQQIDAHETWVLTDSDNLPAQQLYSRQLSPPKQQILFTLPNTHD